VTQPGFLFERGDAYLAEVPMADRPWLYRCRGFVSASVPLGGGTDAPFGDPDPWRAMAASVSRRTRDGVAIGADEALTPERALAMFTTPLDAPGGSPRRIERGVPADLCLLDVPWRDARSALSSERVVSTWCRGHHVA
jgi:predicted amidohydrolase YtcJ